MLIDRHKEIDYFIMNNLCLTKYQKKLDSNIRTYPNVTLKNDYISKVNAIFNKCFIARKQIAMKLKDRKSFDINALYNRKTFNCLVTFLGAISSISFFFLY